MMKKKWIQHLQTGGRLLVLVLLGCCCILFAAPYRVLTQNKEEDSSSNTIQANPTAATDGFIQWVEFHVTSSAMQRAYDYDRTSHGSDCEINWIDLLAGLGAKYGGDFSRYRASDMDALVKRLRAGETMAQIQSENSYYDYYREAYEVVLGEFVGDYEILLPDETGKSVWQSVYGLKAFSPIAEGYYYNHYDDFGAQRSYGYSRPHLGHDLMASVGTPVIAVESGIVEELGWNQYGGWRIGIRSFDGKRYYYYAHLRQNRPYHPDVVKGATISAGDVIGYVGRTGYSTVENTNNMTVNHLHWGLQLIFDESQKNGNHEIWIDLYEITKFLSSHRSTVYRVDETKEYYRKYDFLD